jgi:PAS domain S-box-containing protein
MSDPHGRSGISSVTAESLTNSFFEEIFERAPEGIAILGVEARVVRVNREFTRIFGYSQDEAAGRDIHELIVPPDRRQEAQGFARRAMIGDTFQKETVRIHKNGMRIDVSILITPLFAPDGSAGVYAIYRDISERVRMDQAMLSAYADLEAIAHQNAADAARLRAYVKTLKAKS